MILRRATAAFLLLSAILSAASAEAPHRPAWRGVVEGFNDVPWTHAERLAQIHWMGRHGMNLYIYAPKRDAYHRAEWRTPYPPEEMARFAELARAGRESGITVMYAISPGLSMRYTSDEDIRLILEKLDALATVGIPRFALFFDDIPWELQHEEDKAAFSNLGAAQVSVLNRVYADLNAKGLADPFITVTTQYMNVRPNAYKAAYRDGLDPGILVMWTGDGITRPATLTPATVYAFRKVYGRPPFLWDNYPVNDYNKSRLFLAPLTRRYDVGNLVSGFTMNPLTQPLLGRLSLSTAAEYLMDTASYQPWASWEKAKDELFGRDPEARPVLDAIADLNAERPKGPNGGPWLVVRLDRGARGNASALTELEGFFARLEAAESVLHRRRAALPEPGIVDELQPWLPAVAKVGAAGGLAVQMYRKPTPELRARLRAAWAEARAGVGGKTAATRAVADFVEAVL